MNEVTRGTRIPVNMTLDAELVRQASALTPDLSETIERLLMAYIAGKRTQPPDKDRGIDALIAWHNDFVTRHGLPGEDFMPL